MPLRVRTYTVDIDKQKYERPLYKQFDNNIDFKLAIFDKGIKIDLTNFNIVAFFETPNGDVIQKNCTVGVAPNTNIVTTQLDNNILAYQGFVKAEFNFIEGQAPNQKVVTSFCMLIEVEPTIDRNEAVTKQPQWDILTSFQTTLDEAVAKAEQDVQASINKLPKWHHGTGAPTGLPQQERFNEGDYYLNKDNGDVYRKNVNSWSGVVANIKGLKGDRGNMWHLNGRAPQPAEGELGDLHLNTLSGEYYEKLPQGWSLIGVMKGDKGDPGTPGANWFFGAGAPNGAQGTTAGAKNGDYYLNTADSQIYKLNGADWQPVGKAYTHPLSHTTSMITMNDAHNTGKTVQGFFNTGGTIGGATTVSTGNITAMAGNISSGNSIMGNAYINSSPSNANGNVVANNSIIADADVRAGSNVIAGNTLFANRVMGNDIDPNNPNEPQTGSRIALGPTNINCRLDTTDGQLRLFVTPIGTADTGIRINSFGTSIIDFVHNGIDRHQFLTNGQKTGGSMEIDGTVYGMSPTDSPQTLIEYVEYDVNVALTKVIKLDNIYSKMVSKYAVFSSNPDIKIIKKEPTQFTVQGTGVADFVIKGQRKGADEYYRIMGGITHGTTEVKKSK